jgi:hypothetical protein
MSVKYGSHLRLERDAGSSILLAEPSCPSRAVTLNLMLRVVAGPQAGRRPSPPVALEPARAASGRSTDRVRLWVRFQAPSR